MKKELNMAKWIVALRSSKYKQSSYTLRNDTGYCCLGVACSVSKLGRWSKGDKDKEGQKAYLVGKGARQTSDLALLPSRVVSWLGLFDNNPVVSVEARNGNPIAASRANDGYQWTFADIADKLEARYLSGRKAEDIVKRLGKK